MLKIVTKKGKFTMGRSEGQRSSWMIYSKRTMFYLDKSSKRLRFNQIKFNIDQVYVIIEGPVETLPSLFWSSCCHWKNKALYKCMELIYRTDRLGDAYNLSAYKILLYWTAAPAIGRQNILSTKTQSVVFINKIFAIPNTRENVKNVNVAFYRKIGKYDHTVLAAFDGTFISI